MKVLGVFVGMLALFAVLFFATGVSSNVDLASKLEASATKWNSGEILEGVVQDDEEKSDSVIFVGDVMLARDVERRLPRLFPGNPFSEMTELLSARVVVGNFESSIPTEHKATPDYGMKFSVDPTNLDVLVEGGFTHLSLANNHALDHGADAYQNTLSELTARGFVSGGHPTTLASSSISLFNLAEQDFALVFINATFGYPDDVEWVPYVEQLNESGKTVIAYVHWGDEYQLVHNNTQENFSHRLIDAGVDLIVGHHPHVVQDIGLYKDRLIFYSLGNLVFDQYWDNDVTEGLVLNLLKVEDDWQVDLNPVESRTVKTQPREMDPSESSVFFRRLAERSDPALFEQILDGTLSLQF